MELLFPAAAAPLEEASGSLLLRLASFLGLLAPALALPLAAFCVRARLRGMAIDDESEEDRDDDDDGEGELAGEEEDGDG
jgi:hypothetical protein